MALTKGQRLAINTLDDDFVLCRTRRHVFEDVPYVGHHKSMKWQPSKSVEILAQRCVRCSMVREEVWNAYTGLIITVQYRAPRGYHLGKDVKPKDVRREYIARRRNTTNGKFAKL